MVPKTALTKVPARGRTSVSAEVYGVYNKKTAFVPKVVEKEDNIKEALRQKLIESFMFRALEPDNLKIVIDAMNEVIVKRDEVVIKQGDTGDELYFVLEGSLDCYRQNPGSSEKTHLLTYSEGMVFGELALLYNTYRAASIVANEGSLLYTLDRETFNNIVKESAIQKRQKYDDFLSGVELLQDLEAYERGKICDCLNTETYAPGKYIINEGDMGNTFYFIESGKAYATKKNAAGN